MSHEPFNAQQVKEALRQCWSKQSSSKWTADNPACGQCSVTALVIQEIFGGDIAKTHVVGQPHFYNIINGIRHDLTVEQFGTLPEYDDIPSGREEAFTDTNQQQYDYLLARIKLPR